MISRDVFAKIKTNETIKWSAQPEYRGYVFDLFVNPLVIFGAIFFGVPLCFLTIGFFENVMKILSGDANDMQSFILLIFMIFVWSVPSYFGGKYLWQLVTVGYQNAAYILTDKALYVSFGASKFKVNRHPLHLFEQITYRGAWLKINPVQTGKITLYKYDRHKVARKAFETENFLVDSVIELSGVEKKGIHLENDSRALNRRARQLKKPDPVCLTNIKDYKTVVAMITEAAKQATQTVKEERKRKNFEKNFQRDFNPDE